MEQSKLAIVSFKEGDQVETRSDEEGFVGAWYAAEIVHLEDQNHCVVEYAELLNEDGHPLQESVLMSNMRPRPPLLSSPLKFRKGDFVEAYDRDGWWYGIVVGTSSNRVSVYFRITHETMDFPPHLLRHYQTWENGLWKDLTEASQPEDDNLCHAANANDSPDSQNGKRKINKSSNCRSLNSGKVPKKIFKLNGSMSTDRLPADVCEPVDEEMDACFLVKSLEYFHRKQRGTDDGRRIGLLAYGLLEQALRLKGKGSVTWEQEALLSKVRLHLDITNKEHCMILQNSMVKF